jgi:hypothetical protein
MDMNKHLPRWLNDAALAGLGGRYEGTIAAVVEERVRNSFKRDGKGKPLVVLEPVIQFEDRWRLVPNIGMRKVLIETFGAETDLWVGRRVVVERHQTGTGKWEKKIQVGAGSMMPADIQHDDDDERDIIEHDEYAGLPTADEVFGGRKRFM